MSRVFYIAGVNLALAAVLLLMIEGCVRVTHPEIQPLGTDDTLIADSIFGSIAGLSPGASGTSSGARFSVSPAGFWEYANNGPADSAWLFLGDSVTMGVGVDPDSTFVGLLADRLESYKLLNPSLMAYGAHEYAVILDSVLARRDDVVRVTIVWCLNDIYAREAGTKDPDQGLRRTLGPVLGFVHRNVYTYQWLKATLFDRPHRYFQYDASLYDSPLLDTAVEDLDRISTTCHENELRCEIVLVPYEYQLRADVGERAFHPQERFAAKIKRLNLPLYDAAGYLQSSGRPSTELYLYADGIHFSREGHALLAEFLTDLGKPVR